MSNDWIDVKHWNRSWLELGAPIPDPSVYQRLIERYGEADRSYHTLQHLQECFAHFSKWLDLDVERSLSCHRAEIEIALWFHDAIYDPQRSDNEDQSGQWADQVIQPLGLSSEVADRIQDLILVTRHDATPQTLDAQILIDIDLAILGASEKRFDEYERQVRQEYGWVTDADFDQARGQILAKFLARPYIYNTNYFQAQLESQARMNLMRSLRP